jgi:hypothetical protein
MSVAFFRTRKRSWGLGAATKPQKGMCVSGVVHTLDETGPGYCHVKFNWALPADLGKAMPRGIGRHEPCYLLALRMSEEVWYIFCCYTSGGRRVVWKEDGKPSWIRAIKRKEKENG